MNVQPMPVAVAKIDGLKQVVNAAKPERREKAGAGLEGALRAINVSEFLSALTPPTYALDGVLIKGYCFAITGHSGHGKTAIALTLAVCGALGLPFAGLEMEKTRVLYIAGENPDDVRMRVLALLEALDIDAVDLDGHLQFLDQSFTLAGKHKELMSLIEQGEFGLVVLDTDQALSSDADENDNRERIEHAKRVRMLTRTGCRPTVIDLCHPPGNAQRTSLRPRGGSSFLAEIDGNLGVWIEDGDTRAELFRTSKFRGPMFDSIHFDIKVVELPTLTDRKGRAMTAAIALPSEVSDAQADAATHSRRIALLADISQHPHASLRERQKRTGVAKNTVSRDLAYLKSKGAISEELNGHDLLPKGKKWLTAN